MSKLKNSAEVFFLRRERSEVRQTEAFQQFFSYKNTLPESIGLAAFSEVFLSPAGCFHWESETHKALLMPLVGKMQIQTDAAVIRATVGSCFLLQTSAEIKNDATEEYARFLLIEFSVAATENLPEVQHFETVYNGFTKVYMTNEEFVTVWLGNFGVRKEATLNLSGYSACLAFVINGIIEVEDRLLETGDALRFSRIAAVSLESFDPNGLFLLITSPTV